MKELATDADKCTGCRSCEIICSYHHNKVFNRRMSSIEAIRDGGRFQIVVHKTSVNTRFPCDLCMDCVKQCAAGALRVADEG